jgi:hypothetical protein
MFSQFNYWIDYRNFYHNQIDNNKIKSKRNSPIYCYFLEKINILIQVDRCRINKNICLNAWIVSNNEKYIDFIGSSGKWYIY